MSKSQENDMYLTYGACFHVAGGLHAEEEDFT